MIEEHTALATLKAVEIVKLAMRDGYQPAILVMQDQPAEIEARYWEDAYMATRFEKISAAKMKQKGFTWGALAVPMVIRETDDDIMFRQPDPAFPVREDEGEEEVIWAFAFDLATGFDICRLRLARDSDGDPIFDEDVEALFGDNRMIPDTPGFMLLQELLKE